MIILLKAFLQWFCSNGSISDVCCSLDLDHILKDFSECFLVVSFGTIVGRMKKQVSCCKIFYSSLILVSRFDFSVGLPIVGSMWRIFLFFESIFVLHLKDVFCFDSAVFISQELLPEHLFQIGPSLCHILGQMLLF